MFVAVTVGALALAACSSPSNTTPTTGATASTGTSTTSSTTTSSIPGLACAARDLVMSVAGSQGAAGTFELTFALRNISGAPCPMNGYPGAQLVGASGTQLPTHVVSGGSYQFTSFAPAPVTLAPGATAYVNLAYSDVPSGTETTCPTATQIQVTPPHAVDHDVVAVNATVCNGGTLTVSPVFSQSSPQVQTTAPSQP
ncbi:MAG TPA: DUF4232 domain-containing protein [Acidimicrobiales bacterium]